MTIGTESLTTAMIPLTLIDEPTFDSRINVTQQEEDQVALRDLGDSLKRRQLQAIIVEGPKEDGRYIRVAGGRRVRAAWLVGMDELRAEVRPISNDADRAIDNITENLKRKDLSTFEIARACMKLREMGVPGRDAAEKLGLSKQRISNLVTSYTGNPPEIVKAWEENDPTLDDHFISELARLKVKGKPATDDQKVALFKERKKAMEAARETGMTKRAAKQAAKGKGSSSAKLAFSEERFFAVKAWALKKKHTEFVKALDYMIQQRKTAPEGIEPDDGGDK